MSSLVRNPSCLILLAFLAGCSGKKESGGDRKSEDEQRPKDAGKKPDDTVVKPRDKDEKPPIDESPSGIRVSGETISKAFHDDLKAASAKYKGKLIEVNSLVEKVGV